MENERDRKAAESDDVIANTEGGDPGVTHESVAKARRANPEQAPGRPEEPPHLDREQDEPGTERREDEADRRSA